MGEILRHPITEASAWRSSEAAKDDSWIYRFSPAELAELDAAVEAVKAKGLRAFAFGREDFPLPMLAARIEEFRDEIENGRGFVMLRGIPVPDYGTEALQTIYWGLGVHLGTPITQNPRGELLAEVIDRGNDYNQNNVRGNTTRAAILPHCDSADAVGLFCIHPAKAGGASMIASSMTIYNEVLANHPEYLEPLCRGFHIDLASKGPTGGEKEVTRNRIPVFSWYKGRMSCRFNEKQTIDGAVKVGEPLTPFEREAVACVRELALRPDIRFDMDFQIGDIQLLNNHTILHARTDFEDWPEPERKRRLLRIWLNLPNSRELAPEFADRLNTGPRGGVAFRPNVGWNV